MGSTYLDETSNFAASVHTPSSSIAPAFFPASQGRDDGWPLSHGRLVRVSAV